MARQPRSLAGKVVVITGGAQGIGAATGTALHRLGARVVLGDLDQVRAEKTADELGPDVVPLPLDVTDTAAFTAFLDEVEQRVGPIDVLINNAGIMPLALLEEEDDATTRRILEINLHAVVHGTREAVRRMKPRRSGHIVNLASIAGKSGFAGAATYCASKHAVVGLSESVHLELRGSGVDVSCVLPAVVRTELASGLGEARFVKSVKPEDVAAAIVDALRYPKFDVFVPKSLDLTGRFTRLFPRSAAEWFMRALGGDRLLSSAVHSPARAEYESRAARSAPASDSRE
ncbi:SDR family oxidoreductase [Amycolatopsis jiangsuensis]|uniref:NAD(P)-dependent dehydrogenase (Short-subunit alcohol dehydrogenase family) n=1 Tax=Amycolatopsis jiangsuensis TaxID=1181879 RepID=A0A840J5A2_9PSEU|nr:SDR family oxidoreductase [Amycolatopsis jiangsuensis]MBB4688612.1 NAD(P)-dependent dehydrogenase (short-subunit alcohol dehydrogenase family) [Amycolatopsis jiangsuensis]